MNTILVLTDNSKASKHAARFALAIAQRIKANILLAVICKAKSSADEMVLADGRSENLVEKDKLNCILKDMNHENDFLPELTEIDVSGCDEGQLIRLINEDRIWMIIKGMSDDSPKDALSLNLNSILNRVQCPLILVPETWTLKSIERITYLADLRYCRINIVRFLEELAAPFEAEVSIANLSAKGLPHMADDYALTLFNEVGYNAPYNQLLFNNIKERNLESAIDIIVNGLHSDLLAIVNHRFHFEEILGRYLTDKLPASITVPLVIFPY
ncbi:MAG: hypothetical protein JWP37_1608 [Mucilaginibacter sp.]|nr:hypothetical protein [Mucilaginibacter sp.]